MITFIQRIDDPEIPPPYRFPNVTIMSFRLPASLASLQALCDQQLNIGSLADRGFEYRAFTDFVDMEILTYPRMLFDQQPYSSMGYASQQELYFRFYVWKFNVIGGLLFPDMFPQICFPFIYVDNSWSMISGRNVIGLPKVLAQFQPAALPAALNQQIKISALALKTFSTATKLDWQPIVQIDPQKAVAALKAPALKAAKGTWPWIGLMPQAEAKAKVKAKKGKGKGKDKDKVMIKATVSDPYIQAKVNSHEFLTSVPSMFSTVQLKQFRDLPSGACFQAVVNTPFTPSNIGMPKPLPPVTVTVNSYASLDIPGNLGLPPGVPLRPLLQYSISLDMGMGSGSDLFVNS
jgi:hypothetical protein